MKNIKTALLLFTQLTFTIISFANCNCFEKNISKIGNQINYLQIAIENGIEEKFCFQIKDNQVVLDTLGKVGISKILKPSVEDIDWKILLETCETSNLPKSFCIEFKLDKIDSIYVTNQILTIQKQSTKYIMNPSKEEHHFYSNSKLAIKKQWNWNTSFNYRKGRKTVFKYLYTHEESPFWDDDEKIEAVYFQIQNGINEFSFENEELLKIKLFYESICEGSCYKRNISTGFVTGKLINGEWLIKLSIDELEFEKKFKPVKIKQ